MEVATTALKLGSPVTHVGPFEKREAIPPLLKNIKTNKLHVDASKSSPYSHPPFSYIHEKCIYDSKSDKEKKISRPSFCGNWRGGW